MTATTSGLNRYRSSRSCSPSLPAPRFQSRMARSMVFWLACTSAASASAALRMWQPRPALSSHSRNVLRTGSSSSTMRMVSAVSLPGVMSVLALEVTGGRPFRGEPLGRYRNYRSYRSYNAPQRGSRRNGRPAFWERLLALRLLHFIGQRDELDHLRLHA